MRSGNEEHDSQVTLVNLVQDAAVSVQCICSFSSAMKIKQFAQLLQFAAKKHQFNEIPSEAEV